MKNLLFPLLALPLFLAGCKIDDVAPTSDQKMNQQQEMLANEAASSVGMPAMTFFTEKRLVKMLFELRDDPKLATITYTRDMGGKLHKVCNSVGYGIPYATQFTNPQKVVMKSGTHEWALVAIPQADPNGLFSPANADATWVMCLDPKDGKVKPVYIEDRVTVSQYELESN